MRRSYLGSVSSQPRWWPSLSMDDRKTRASPLGPRPRLRDLTLAPESPATADLLKWIYIQLTCALWQQSPARNPRISRYSLYSGDPPRTRRHAFELDSPDVPLAY
jgi:hypothetical protein